ncbi:MAG TPA: hypothetical protein VNJ47_07965 [Nevskiales bacterium]|nr:hypothetical protein [Nevskiales bacterium]
MKAPRLHEDPARTTPHGLIRYASEFYAAAVAVDDSLDKKQGYEIFAPVPVMFLAGQSIELSLKAFLLAKGIDLRALRLQYGHKLSSSLQRAKKLGLGDIVVLTDTDESAIAVLDPLYSSKQLQYIITGVKTYPIFGPLEEATRKLLEAVAVFVDYPPHRLPHVP